VTEKEAAAQEGLRSVVFDLRNVRERLKEIVDGLPPSPQEEDLEDLSQEPDVTTEVRRVVLCVLQDNLSPAIDDLTAASEYRPGRHG
jgi:hypothetical protein